MIGGLDYKKARFVTRKSLGSRRPPASSSRRPSGGMRGSWDVYRPDLGPWEKQAVA